MTNNLKNFLSVFKEIDCPFIASVFKNEDIKVFIRFNEHDFLSLNLTQKSIQLNNSCNTYFIEHNLKEVDFNQISIKINDHLNQLSKEDFNLATDCYIIKSLNNKLYLADDYMYEDKIVDLSSETLPECVDYTLVDI